MKSRADGAAAPARRRAYLGLGSNVGRRLRMLREATRLLDGHPAVRVVARSHVYETEPVGEVLDQRAFYNAVVRVETEFEPEALLDACKAVERELGRDPGRPRHGPRPIDVDVLLLGDRRHRSARLELPHPEVTSRRFVLVPLLELDPPLRTPDGTALIEALRALGPGQAVRRAGPPLT